MNYFWPGSINTHCGPGPINTNFGPGSGAGAGGQGQGRGLSKMPGAGKYKYPTGSTFLSKIHTSFYCQYAKFSNAAKGS